MTPQEFFKRFPDEASCIHHMGTLREENGLNCRACDSKRMSWAERLRSMYANQAKVACYSDLYRRFSTKNSIELNGKSAMS